VDETAREFVAQPVGSALRHLGAGARVITPALTTLKATRGFHDALIAPGFHELFEGSEPSIWSTEMPAVNGALSAGALARLYGALANGGAEPGGPRLLSAATVHDLGRVHVRTRDGVLGLNMRWRLGYHHAFGTGRAPKAFGHYGYGGSGGWADPDLGLSLGFVTNRIGSVTTPMADLTLYRLGRVVRDCALSASSSGSLSRSSAARRSDPRASSRAPLRSARPSRTQSSTMCSRASSTSAASSTTGASRPIPPSSSATTSR